eukprot:1138227-Pelagomonas_calceolata.AAC.3
MVGAVGAALPQTGRCLRGSLCTVHAHPKKKTMSHTRNECVRCHHTTIVCSDLKVGAHACRPHVQGLIPHPHRVLAHDIYCVIHLLGSHSHTALQNAQSPGHSFTPQFGVHRFLSSHSHCSPMHTECSPVVVGSGEQLVAVKDAVGASHEGHGLQSASEARQAASSHHHLVHTDTVSTTVHHLLSAGCRGAVGTRHKGHGLQGPT